MAIPLKVYSDNLLHLQVEYDGLHLGPYVLKIEPVNGLDLFYSDGSAANYLGKIVEFDEKKGYGLTQRYFTSTGLEYKTKTDKDELFQKWILETTRQYLESSKQTSLS